MSQPSGSAITSKVLQAWNCVINEDCMTMRLGYYNQYDFYMKMDEDLFPYWHRVMDVQYFLPTQRSKRTIFGRDLLNYYLLEHNMTEFAEDVRVLMEEAKDVWRGLHRSPSLSLFLSLSLSVSLLLCTYVHVYVWLVHRE